MDGWRIRASKKALTDYEQRLIDGAANHNDYAIQAIAYELSNMPKGKINDLVQTAKMRRLGAEANREKFHNDSLLRKVRRLTTSIVIYLAIAQDNRWANQVSNTKRIENKIQKMNCKLSAVLDNDYKNGGVPVPEPPYETLFHFSKSMKQDVTEVYRGLKATLWEAAYKNEITLCDRVRVRLMRLGRGKRSLVRDYAEQRIKENTERQDLSERWKAFNLLLTKILNPIEDYNQEFKKLVRVITMDATADATTNTNTNVNQQESSESISA